MSALRVRPPTEAEIAAARARAAQPCAPSPRGRPPSPERPKTLPGPTLEQRKATARAARLELERLRDEALAVALETEARRLRAIEAAWVAERAPERPAPPRDEPTREQYLAAIEWTGIKAEGFGVY